MKLTDILTKAHAQVLEARSVEYLLQSRDFEDVWKSSNTLDKAFLLEKPHLTIKDIKSWAQDIRERNIELLSSRELRAIARSMRIQNYSRITLCDLKIIILKVWEENERKRDPIS
jgi:hypothetical protein